MDCDDVPVHLYFYNKVYKTNTHLSGQYLNYSEFIYLQKSELFRDYCTKSDLLCVCLTNIIVSIILNIPNLVLNPNPNIYSS